MKYSPYFPSFGLFYLFSYYYQVTEYLYALYRSIHPSLCTNMWSSLVGYSYNNEHVKTLHYYRDLQGAASAAGRSNIILVISLHSLVCI